MYTDFIDWLNEELSKRDWSMRELARRANVSPSTINHVMAGRRNPGTVLCNGLAQAFNMSPESVLKKAGLIPNNSHNNTERMTIREIWSILRQMDDNQLNEVRNYARYVKSLDQHPKHMSGATDKTPDDLEPAKQ